MRHQKLRFTDVVLCPDCHTHLWITRRDGNTVWTCIACGQTWDVPKPKEQHPENQDYNWKQLDFLIDADT